MSLCAETGNVGGGASKDKDALESDSAFLRLPTIGLIIREFEAMVSDSLYSATPGEYELKESKGCRANYPPDGAC
jgi:hypothetical protein